MCVPRFAETDGRGWAGRLIVGHTYMIYTDAALFGIWCLYCLLFVADLEAMRGSQSCHFIVRISKAATCLS
jgi:hypothetical protein